MPAKHQRVSIVRDALDTHEDVVLAGIAAVWERGPKSK